MGLCGVSCNILRSAAGLCSRCLPYVVLLFCFACWCWGAYKSPTPIACTLLSDLGHATFRYPVLAALLCYQKGRLACKSGCHGCAALHCRTGPLAPHDTHSLAEGHRFCLNLASNHLLCCWSAQKSLAPRTRTLLGVLGHSTFNFVAVATLLFFFFCECTKFCDLAEQRQKFFLGVSEVGTNDFALYFFRLCPLFLVFLFLLLQLRDGSPHTDTSHVGLPTIAIRGTGGRHDRSGHQTGGDGVDKVQPTNQRDGSVKTARLAATAVRGQEGSGGTGGRRAEAAPDGRETGGNPADMRTGGNEKRSGRKVAPKRGTAGAVWGRGERGPRVTCHSDWNIRDRAAPSH